MRYRRCRLLLGLSCRLLLGLRCRLLLGLVCSLLGPVCSLVGRVCVGLALLGFLYGLIAKAMRFGGLVLLILIGARALANEGVIEVPKLRAMLSDAREDREGSPLRPK